MAQHPLIALSGGLLPGRTEVAQVRPGRRHRRGVVGDEHVDHAVADLHRHRPHVAGRDHAEAAALDHRRAAHAEAAALGRDDDVTRRGQGGVAREAVAGDDGDQRDLPVQLGDQPERGHVELGDRGGVGVTRAAAPALGEDHHGQLLAAGQLEQAVGLAVVLDALGAGQDGVVVGHHRDRPAADRRGAHHQAVSRGPLDQVAERAAAALGGDGERPVLHEGPVVDQVSDVLPGGAAAAGVPPRGRVLPVGVRAHVVPLDRLVQIRADVVEVGRGRPGALRPVVVARVDGGEQGPGRDRLPDLHGHARDHAGAGGCDDVLHLHGLQHEKLPARRDRLAGPGRDGHDRPVQRRADRGLVPRRSAAPAPGDALAGATVPSGDSRPR